MDDTCLFHLFQDALVTNLSNTLDAIQTSFHSYRQIQESMTHLSTVQSGTLHYTHIG